MERIKNAKFVYYILLCLILIFGFCLRLKGFLSNPSFWLDESALGWNVLNKRYIELFDKLRFLQIAPPLFLIFSKFLVFITDSYHHVYRCDMVLRLIPFIFGNLSMIMFYFTAKKLTESQWAVLAGVVFIALNPVLINYCFEFKPYSLDVFASLLIILIFLNIDFKNTNLKQIFLYGLFLAILPWFSFGCVFVIIAGFLTLSFKKENPRLFTSLLAMPIVSGFVYLNLFVINSYSQNSAGMLGYWHKAFINPDFSNVYEIIKETVNYFFINIPHFSVTLAMICAAAGFALFCKKRKWNFIQISILTFAAVVTASILKYYPFSTRMVLFLLPILIIFIVNVTAVKKWFIGWVLIIALIIPHWLFAFQFINLTNLTRGSYARNMMQILALNINPIYKIVLNNTSNADYFYYNYFFKFNNKIEYLKPNYEKSETNQLLLHRLEKGKYIFFLSYDSNSSKADIKEIKNWAHANATILYGIYTAQSTLMWLILH